MKWIAAYFIIGALWSAWAVRMQFKSGLSRRVDAAVLVCALSNWLFWPVGMLFAWLAWKMDSWRDE